MTRMSDGLERTRANMSNDYTVVIVDAGNTRQLMRCLRELLSTVGADTDVVAVSRQLPNLGGLARRVRRLQLHSGELLADVIRSQVRPGRFTVVARSQCRWHAGWRDNLVRCMDQAGADVATLGQPTPYVEVYTGSADAAPIDLGTVRGIQLPTASRAATVGPVSVSASLIVKDEEEAIERCLRALQPLVDEIIVYDTGSTDRTVALAEAAGAVVIRGYWDDDFGAARNRSLEYCSAEWVLPVDADEVVQGDPEGLRRFLRGVREDVVRVDLVNVAWDGADDGDAYVVERLFRRASGAWAGAIHERIVSRRDGGPLVVAMDAAPVRLVHLGYTADRVKAKSKGQRNLDIAAKELAARPTSATAWCDYGRSLSLAGRHADAVAALDHLLTMTVPPTVFVLGGRSALQSLAAVKASAEHFGRWLDALAEYGEAPGRVHLERARLWLREGDLEGAATELASVDSAPDCWGVSFDEVEAAGARAELIFRQGDPAQSYGVLVAATHVRPESVALPALLLAAMRASIAFEDVCADVPDAFVARSLREVLTLDVENADAWLDAVWTRSRDPRVLVSASLVCRGLGVDRVIVWEMRCMESEQSISPLRAIAADDAACPSSRCLAHAVLADVLGVAESREEAAAQFALTAPDEQDALLLALAQYAPGLVEHDAAGTVHASS